MDDKTKVWSDFWLDEDETHLPFDSDLVFEGKDSDHVSLDDAIIKMAAGRRAIANFVNILTGEDIPVFFWSGNQTGATDGKTVYLSADIVKKEDFDSSVGLALHEGSHILLTDFELFKTLWGRISDLYKLGKEVGISKDKVSEFAKLMFNYVEDRYIDNYIYTTAPGYQPYYVALYDKYFNSKEITEQLKSDLMRQPTLAAYEARIINLTNINTDLKALPGLREIAEQLSLKTIGRLKDPKDRVKVAIEISKIVLKNIKKDIEDQKNGNPSNSGSPGKGDQGKRTGKKTEISFDMRVDDTDENSDSKDPKDSKNSNDSKDKKDPKNDKDGKDKGEGKDEKGNSKGDSEGDEDDVLGGSKVETETVGKDNKPAPDAADDIGDDPNVSKTTLKKLKKEIDRQKEFLDGQKNVKKKSVTDKQSHLLDAIEKSGIIIVQVGMDLVPGNQKALAIDCVVVKKMTKELMFSGMFPLAKYDKNRTVDPQPMEYTRDAVVDGIRLGTMLGKKLQIRNETNVTKYMRRKSGKIDKRVISDIACGIESIFYKIKSDSYSKTNLHISVDCSGSMGEGSKWTKTMTMLVALCKAGSMIDNLRVSVSLRGTIIKTSAHQAYSQSTLPYVVIAYDSAKDKIAKVKNLFPFLGPTGSTPEGLAYEAILDEVINKKPDEEYYFLNISDGEPCFSYNGPDGISIYYDQTVGGDHTRKQYQKILQTGVQGMSYFIEESRYKGYGNEENSSVKCFKKMYGKTARFIDVNSVPAIAKTMNQLFLNKE